jgi:hypothetical protein
VSNLYSQLLAEAAARDGFLALIITVVGLILLPFTFAAVRFPHRRKNFEELILSQILLTGPMFDFNGTLSGNTISKLPAWKIFGIISGGVFIFFSLIFLGAHIFQQQKQKMREKEKKKKKKRNDSQGPPTEEDQGVQSATLGGGDNPNSHAESSTKGILTQFRTKRRRRNILPITGV